MSESQELNFPFSFLVVINFTISREYLQYIFIAKRSNLLKISYPFSSNYT